MEEERRILVEKIDNLEYQIEHIKKQLGDMSSIEELSRRIGNCESLAGITQTKDEE